MTASRDGTVADPPAGAGDASGQSEATGFTAP